MMVTLTPGTYLEVHDGDIDAGDGLDLIRAIQGVLEQVIKRCIWAHGVGAGLGMNDSHYTCTNR